MQDYASILSEEGMEDIPTLETLKDADFDSEWSFTASSRFSLADRSRACISYWIAFQCLCFELVEEWGEPITFRLLSLPIFVIFLIRLGTSPRFQSLGYQSACVESTLIVMGSVFLFKLRRDSQVCLA
jgi:hypothetical protein